MNRQGKRGGKRVILQPHSSQWFSPACLPYAFDPTARCPLWLAFLADVLEGDPERVAVLQEWFGLCLAPDTTFQKFFMLVGEGSNGKKVILDVLEALLGEANVSHVPLEQFGQRFQLTATLNKLANIVREIGEVGKVAEGQLKTFVSGERMHFDRKGLSPIEAKPTARAVFATNALPKFADRSRGIWRRLIVMPCRVVIALDQEDRLLSDKLMAELPGIFNWAVEGLRRLLDQELFTDAALCRQALNEHQLDSNPARTFLLEQVIRAPGAFVTTEALYEFYGTWCTARGFEPLDDRQFGKEVRRVYDGVERERQKGGRNQKRAYIYPGIALQDQAAMGPAVVFSMAPPPR